MGNIVTTTKFSRLKSISSIEDNYIEATTGGVLWKSFSKKLHNIHRKTSVLESLFNKVAAFRPARLLKRDSNIGAFLCILQTF